MSDKENHTAQAWVNAGKIKSVEEYHARVATPTPTVDVVVEEEQPIPTRRTRTRRKK